jgi:hypothetical protein
MTESSTPGLRARVCVPGRQPRIAEHSECLACAGREGGGGCRGSAKHAAAGGRTVATSRSRTGKGCSLGPRAPARRMTAPADRRGHQHNGGTSKGVGVGRIQTVQSALNLQPEVLRLDQWLREVTGSFRFVTCVMTSPCRMKCSVSVALSLSGKPFRRTHP